MEHRIDTNKLDSQVRTMQLIAGALIQGVVVIAALAWLVQFGVDPPSVLSYVAAGCGVAAIALAPVLRPERSAGSGSSRARNSDQDRRVGAYQTRLLVQFAVLEAAALFSALVRMLGGAWWTLVVAGLVLLTMILSFPTRSRIEVWLHG